MLFTLSLTAILATPPSPVTAAAYSLDGTLLLAGTRGQAIVFDAASGDDRQINTGLAGRVTACAWLTKSLYVIATGEPGQSGTISIHELGQGKPLSSWKAHTDSIFALAVTPNGKTLASAGYDRVIKLWNVGGDNSKPLAELKDHSDAIYALSMHPNGQWLASGSADRAVKVWDLVSGKRLYTLGDNTDWVYALSWSPDGKRLAAGGIDKSIRVWKADGNGGTLERSAFAHAGPIVKMAYAETTRLSRLAKTV